MKKILSTIPIARQANLAFSDPDILSSLNFIVPLMTINSFDPKTGMLEGYFTDSLNAEQWVLKRAAFHMQFGQWAAALQVINDSPFKEGLFQKQITEKIIQGNIQASTKPEDTQRWQFHLDQLVEKKKDIQRQFADECTKMRENPFDDFFKNFHSARHLNPHSFVPWILLLVMMPMLIDLAADTSLLDFAHSQFPIELHNITVFLALNMMNSIKTRTHDDPKLDFSKRRLDQYMTILTKWYPLSIAVKQLMVDPGLPQAEDAYNSNVDTAKLKLLAKMPQEALMFLSHAKQIAPHSPLTYALMGLAHLQLEEGDIAKAQELYFKAINALDYSGQKCHAHIVKAISDASQAPKETKENYPDEVIVLEFCIRIMSEKLKGNLQGLSDHFAQLTEWVQTKSSNPFSVMIALRFAVQQATEAIQTIGADSKRLTGEIIENSIKSATLVGHYMYRHEPTEDTLEFISQFFECTQDDTSLSLKNYEVGILFGLPDPTDLRVAPMAQFILQEFSQEIASQLGAKQRVLTQKLIQKLTAADYHPLITELLPEVLKEILESKEWGSLQKLTESIFKNEITIENRHRQDINALVHHEITTHLGPWDIDTLIRIAPYLQHLTQSPVLIAFFQSLQTQNLTPFLDAVKTNRSAFPDLDLALMHIALAYRLNNTEQAKKYLKIAKKLVVTGEIPPDSNTPITHYLQWQLRLSQPQSHHHAVILQKEKLMKMQYPQSLQSYEKPSPEILGRIWQACLAMSQASIAPLHSHIPSHQSGLSQLLEFAHIHLHRRHGELPRDQKKRLAESPDIDLKRFQKMTISLSCEQDESDTQPTASMPTQNQKRWTDRLKAVITTTTQSRMDTDIQIPQETSQDYTGTEVKSCLKAKNLRAITRYVNEMAEFQLEKQENPKTSKKPPEFKHQWMGQNTKKFTTFLDGKAQNHHETLTLRAHCQTFLTQGEAKDLPVKLAYLAACVIQTISTRDRKKATYDIAVATQQDAQWLHDLFYWDAIIHGEQSLMTQHHIRPTDTPSPQWLTQIEACWAKVEDSCHGPEQHLFGEAPIQPHYNAGVLIDFQKELRNIHIYFFTNDL